MDEINRGASYPAILSLLPPIFAHFESNSMVYPLLCAAAPPIYDSILTNALSNDASLQAPAELYIQFLVSEGADSRGDRV